MFSPCAFPGAMTVRAPGDSNTSPGGFPETNCLYRLTIKNVNLESGEVKATVAESVIEGNSNRRKHYFSRQLFSTDIFTDFDTKNYPPHVYAFQLQDKNLASQLVVNRDYDFENVPDTHFLKLCNDTCMEERAKQCRKYYDSKPEDNRCGEKQDKS
jgi:hypothetical protein